METMDNLLRKHSMHGCMHHFQQKLARVQRVEVFSRLDLEIWYLDLVKVRQPVAATRLKYLIVMFELDQSMRPLVLVLFVGRVPHLRLCDELCSEIVRFSGLRNIVTLAIKLLEYVADRNYDRMLVGKRFSIQ